MPFSFLSSLLGMASNSETNSTNRQIAQMNNQWSERMLDKQIAYNKEQWNKEAAWNEKMWNMNNEYNSASAQAQRFREAGLNPALVMGGSNAGTASSGSAPSGNSIGLPSPSTIPMQSYQPDLSGVSNAILGYMNISAQNKKTNEETKQIHIDNQTRAVENAVRIYELLTKIDGTKYENTIKKHLAAEFPDYLQGKMDYTKAVTNQANSQALVNEETARGLLVQRAMNVVHLIHLPQKYQLEFSSMMANTALAVANKELTDNKAITEILNWSKTIEETDKVKLDNDLIRSTFDSMVEKAKNEAERSSQPQTPIQLLWDGVQGMNAFSDHYQNKAKDWFNKNVVKPSKKAWKDTRRSFGLYW